jgi:hypothetical protein
VHDSLADAEYAPALHFVQSPLPVTFLYVPAGHAAHASIKPPVYPALQVQASTVVLPLGEVEFAGHGVHAPKSSATLNVPAAHGMHGPPSPSGRVYPASQGVTPGQQ